MADELQTNLMITFEKDGVELDTDIESNITVDGNLYSSGLINVTSSAVQIPGTAETDGMVYLVYRGNGESPETGGVVNVGIDATPTEFKLEQMADIFAARSTNGAFFVKVASGNSAKVEYFLFAD
tara:strand:- start:1547 stop:1921 length:375 start_codon:yes stop_codon:yes gene_type:complete